MLRAHGLVHKIQRSHRYELTQCGRLLAAPRTAARQANTQQLLAIAARDSRPTARL
jgi:hypothetical protein